MPHPLADPSFCLLRSQYLPIEFALSFAVLGLTSLVGPWFFALVTVPLAAFNLSRFQQKDHRIHFIAKREYKKDFKRMERSFLVKSVVYGVLLAGTLVYTIISLCDWLSKISRRDR